MQPTLVLLALATVAGVPSAAQATEPAPRLIWRSPIVGLPAATDPAPIEWRVSNQIVYRLNGHVGHWRGELQLPPIEPDAAPPPADKPGAERRP